MKVTKKDIDRVVKILKNTKWSMANGVLFIPIEANEKRTDEFGIESTSYKADTFYGNKLITGIVYTCSHVEPALAYLQTTDVFSFNLKEYYSLIKQYNGLTTSDIDFITQFEVCIAKQSNLAFVTSDSFALTDENINDTVLTSLDIE